ncbi:sperm acrosome membrane-associated protein 4-like [Diretmus argenteus]
MRLLFLSQLHQYKAQIKPGVWEYDRAEDQLPPSNGHKGNRHTPIYRSHALNCYKCDIGFWNVCLTRETTCAAGEHCYSGVGQAVGVVNVMMKGCLKEMDCNKTQEVNYPSSSSNNSVYTMTRTCCDSDLCNAAPGLPTGAMLPLTLAAITTVLMSKVLV